MITMILTSRCLMVTQSFVSAELTRYLAWRVYIAALQQQCRTDPMARPVLATHDRPNCAQPGETTLKLQVYLMMKYMSSQTKTRYNNNQYNI